MDLPKNKKKGQKIGSLVGKIGGSYVVPFKNGCYVNKTQPALLHKGELVVPKHLVKHVSKSLKNKIKKNGGRNMC